MIFEDAIYGSFDINDKVIIELVNSKPVQRLKCVSQHAAPVEGHTDYTRYEHSIGVMLLLRKFGASLDEQVAGLLHDISHTAFSHVVDWVVLADPEMENYQDSMLATFLKRPELRRILSKFEFDVEKLSSMEKEGNYPLLERNAPDLCADRLDYTFRDLRHWFNPDLSDCSKGLVVMDNEFMFNSRNAARAFGNYYIEMRERSTGQALSQCSGMNCLVAL